MKKSKKLNAMSIQQASDFWDEHEFTEFEDVQEVKDIRFSLKKKKYLGVDMDLYKKIKKKAKELNKTEESLVSKWLSEKVQAQE